MSIRVNVDGIAGDESARLVSPLDQGFLFGASVYETVRTYGGRPFQLARHIKRLRESAAALEIAIEVDDDELIARVHGTLEEAGNPESQIRIIASAGTGVMDYRRGSASKPTLAVIVRPLPDYPEELYRDGATAVFVDIKRAAPGNLSPRIKSSNLLNNLMALRRAQAKGAYEALMSNGRGEVTEGSMSNVFVVKGGTILTPPLDAGILEGITREILLAAASDHELPLREETLLPEDVLHADEVFITASARQVVPIVRVDDVTIGEGKPGPMTNKLMLLYQEKVHQLMGPAPNDNEKDKGGS